MDHFLATGIEVKRQRPVMAVRVTNQTFPVREALSAAHQAPNHKHTWPWRFTHVGPETKQRINELALKMKSANGPLEGPALTLFRQKRIHPQLMIVSQTKCEDAMQRREDYAAVSCAIQNFMLALSSRGIGSKWSTGSMTRHPIAYELSQVDAEREEIVGFIWYGVPAKTPSPRRPALEEVLREVP